jgi:hypothetical protein
MGFREPQDAEAVGGLGPRMRDDVTHGTYISERPSAMVLPPLRWARRRLVPRRRGCGGRPAVYRRSVGSLACCRSSSVERQKRRVPGTRLTGTRKLLSLLTLSMALQEP